MVTRPILPVILIAPALLALFVIILFFSARKKAPRPQKFFRMLRVAGIFALIFLVNLRIQHKRYDFDVELKNIDILFVLDTTISMWADDANGYDTRMEQAVADCNYIMEEMAGSNFGLIRFDNRAQILAPFTQDRNNVRDALSTIKMPDTFYAKGSSLNTPLPEMEDLLLSSSEKSERTTVLFFLSDGEITDGSNLDSYEFLETYVDAGAILGYGTLSGGNMTDANNYGHITDPDTGDLAISYLDEENLRLIASDLRVDYIHMRAPGDLSYLLSSIRAGSTTSVGEDEAAVYDDTYFYYVIPLVALLLWELFLFIRKRRL